MQRSVLRTAVACIVLSLLAAANAAIGAELRHAEPGDEQLIGALTSLDCPIPGVSATGTFFGRFLAEEDSIGPAMTVLIEKRGQLSYPAPCQNANAQEIVHRGPKVLPALIRHLDDKRPTKLVVGQEFSNGPIFGGQFFGDEYDARRRGSSKWMGCEATMSCRVFAKPYTVKVGDVCFVLIGQIVNRYLSAVRYQPTAILMVNSPIETPALVDRVRADWAGVDSAGLKRSLLADLRASGFRNPPDIIQSGALRRLRYYFPATYASLTGADLEARRAFEASEHARLKD